MAQIINLLDLGLPMAVGDDCHWQPKSEALVETTVVESNAPFPDKLFQPNAKLNREFFGNSSLSEILCNGEMGYLSEDKRTSNLGTESPGVVSIQLLAFKKDNVVNIVGRFDEFDRVVYEAIGSLYLAAPDAPITLRRICRALTGSASKPSEVLRNRVMNSIFAMSMSRVVIHINEAETGVWAKQEELEFNGPLLAIKWVEGKFNGQITTIFRVLEEPILFRYARALKRVVVTDGTPIVLAVPKLRNNIQNAVIRNYLLRRIGVYRNAKEDGKKIQPYHRVVKTQRIYDLFEEEGLTKKEKWTIRNSVEMMLSYWRDIGFISSYRTINNGRKIHAYEINL